MCDDWNHIVPKPAQALPTSSAVTQFLFLLPAPHVSQSSAIYTVYMERQAKLHVKTHLTTHVLTNTCYLKDIFAFCVVNRCQWDLINTQSVQRKVWCVFLLVCVRAGDRNIQNLNLDCYSQKSCRSAVSSSRGVGFFSPDGWRLPPIWWKKSKNPQVLCHCTPNVCHNDFHSIMFFAVRIEEINVLLLPRLKCLS